MDEKLGKLGKDKVTGFEGVIIGKTEYLYGCAAYGLTPKAVGGKLEDSKWFDEGRIEIIGAGITAEEVKGDKPGGEDYRSPNNRVS